MNAGLGIAVKTYLDELASHPEPTSTEAKYRAQAEVSRMLCQAVDVVADMERAFRLWDAVCTLYLTQSSLLCTFMANFDFHHI